MYFHTKNCLQFDGLYYEGVLLWVFCRNHKLLENIDRRMSDGHAISDDYFTQVYNP